MNCATRQGIEKRNHASRERRLTRRLKTRKRALRDAVPMWRLLRVVVLAFARSFFAFCAIFAELAVREGRVYRWKVDAGEERVVCSIGARSLELDKTLRSWFRMTKLGWS